MQIYNPTKIKVQQLVIQDFCRLFLNSNFNIHLFSDERFGNASNDTELNNIAAELVPSSSANVILDDDQQANPALESLSSNFEI